VYSLLFRDHGVSGSQLSLLLIIWSLTGFVCEVPSGAWADTVDRRLLLVLSAAVYATGFSTWMLWQTFTGFAVGFVCWGLSSALMSGTFEALVYDELVTRGAAQRYPALIGWAHSTAMTANLVATLGAAWLFAAGGYPLVGWTSVAVAVGQGVLAATLPVSRQARRPAHADTAVHETERAPSRYLAMLRAGLAESRHQPDVRRVLALAALMVGLTAYDEYFPLVARDHGVATATVPVLIAVTVLGQVVGTALVGRTAGLRGVAVGGTLAVGAVLVSVGALAAPYPGFVAIALGYGLLNNAMLVGETRLQDTIAGPARATVTSVLGVLEEVVALTVYAAFAVGARVLGFDVLVALLGVPALVVGLAVMRWLPARPVPAAGLAVEARTGAEDSSVEGRQS
jgi:MFS family permease